MPFPQLLDEAIQKLGGDATLARQIGVHRSAVLGWRKARIPAERAPKIAELTGIPLHELRPDLWEASIPPPTSAQAA